MGNLFASKRMAEGYARSRPAVHPHVVERIAARFSLAEPWGRGLDVGCGAGLSTSALCALVRHATGVEPCVEMLRYSGEIAPRACFLGGKAEALPVRAGSMDVVTAAGSLNWSVLGEVYPELRRVLRADGLLVVYDFGQGAARPEDDALRQWQAAFQARYPVPPALRLEPEALGAEPYGFHFEGHERFEVSRSFDARSYLEYAMTETNVEAALGRGIEELSIRRWAGLTLNDVFHGAGQEVWFGGYIAYLRAGAG